jgi:FkbM family methyltransferase
VKKLLRLLAHPTYWPALRRGVAAAVEHSEVPLPSHVDTVVDVGASRGQFALFALNRFPGAKVICLEPQPGPADELVSVVGSRVTLIRSAVGSEVGMATMNISAQDDSSSLLRIGHRQTQEFPGTDHEHTIEVPVTTLDEAVAGQIKRPCLLKIDVQGYELVVLSGASSVLAQTDIALIECSFVELYEGQALAEEVISLMKDAGFRLTGVHGLTYSSDGSAVQGDFLFTRNR